MTFHYLLMANQAIYQRELMEGLKSTGLTSGHPKVLDYLKDHDGAVFTAIIFGTTAGFLVGLIAIPQFAVGALLFWGGGFLSASGCDRSHAGKLQGVWRNYYPCGRT